MKIREQIYLLLKQIVINKKYSNIVLKNNLAHYNQKDKNLICFVVYGTIQNYQWLNYQYNDLVDKKINKKTQILLNSAVFQLLKMEKKSNFAVIDETVEISKKYLGVGNSKFINAVLRKVATRGVRPIEKDEDEKLAIETSCPIWLVKMWKKQYPDCYDKLCYDTLNVSENYIRVNLLKTDLDLLLYDKQFKQLADTCFTTSISDIANHDYFKKGYITIQDYASQQIAKYVDPQKDERILDMCSAPGSKATHLAALMQNTGSITALELHAHRCELIKQQCQRLGVTNLEVKCSDAIEYYDDPFDRILLDAPCSGYGVLKRKSDIKLHMNSNDMDEIIKIQKALLENADQLLKSEGVLVYSTCTLNKKENDNQIKQFVARHNNYEVVETKTFMPYIENCDGFYMAKLIKH